MTSTTGSNVLRRLWSEGRGTLGAWCQIPSPLSAEIMAQCGYDWVCVDMQHGPTGVEALGAMVQSISVAGAAPIVRVPSNEPWLIGRALDLGASGVIVPLVNAPDEAERAAAACRYPPAGRRSYGPVRAPSAAGTDTEACNDHVLCLVMIETREGVENVERICAVPGVDGVYIGPWDLGLSHGLAGPGPELDPIVERILASCRRQGIAAGIATGSGEAARAYLDSGFVFAGVRSDVDLLAEAAGRELAGARVEAGARAEAAGAGLVRVAL